MIYTDNYECLDIPAVLRKYNRGICEEMHHESDEYEEYLEIPTFMRRSDGELAYSRGLHDADFCDTSEAQKCTSDNAEFESDDLSHLFEVLSHRCHDKYGLQITQIADLYDLGLSDDSCSYLMSFVDVSSNITEQALALVYLLLLVDEFVGFDVKLALRGELLGLNLSENILAQLNNCLSQKFRSAQ